jgi:hypothetical protein
MTKMMLTPILLVCGSVMAQEIAGKWTGSFKAEGGDHDIPQLIVIRQSGKQMTGSGGPDDSEQYPISNGIVDGEKVHFELTTARAKFFYDLTRTGANLNGRLEIKSVNRAAKATVSLKKQQ